MRLDSVSVNRKESEFIVLLVIGVYSGLPAWALWLSTQVEDTF